jgi:hypothetical protein
MTKFAAILVLAFGLVTPAFAKSEMDLGPPIGTKAPTIGVPTHPSRAPFGAAPYEVTSELFKSYFTSTCSSASWLVPSIITARA